MELAVPRFINTPPLPRVLRFEVPGRPTEGLWYIACLSLSERLAASGHALLTSALSPWASDTAPPMLDEALARLVQAALPYPGDHDAPVGLFDFSVDALLLAGRLIRRFGVSGRRAGPLGWLVALFDLITQIKHGTTATWHGRLSCDADLQVILDLSEREGLPAEIVLDALWRRSDPGGHPVLPPAIEKLSEPLAERAWRHLPPDVLLSAYANSLHFGTNIEWAWLSPAAWDAVVDWWRKHPHETLHGLEDLPEEHARTLIARRHGGFDGPATWRAFWLRFPDLCRESAFIELSSPPWEPLRDGVACSVPEAEVAPLVAQLQASVAKLRDNETVRLNVLRWAHLQTSARGAGWRAAFGLMGALTCAVP